MLINSPNISGSLRVTGNTVITGSLTVLGGINATITGSATSASYVEYTNVANKPALVSGSSQVTYSGLTGVPSGIVSGSSQITYSGISSIPSGIVSGSSQVTGYNVFATTGSNQFNGSQAVTGSLTVTGQVVAQTLNVQQVTSSIVFSSGSNIFGNSLSNTQQFTGSVSVTGSLAISGTGAFSGALSLNSSANRINSGNELRFYRTDNGIYTQLYDGGAANGFVLDNRNGDGFSFQTAGTNQLRIASTGAATFVSSVTATANSSGRSGFFGGTSFGLRIDNSGSFNNGGSIIHGVDNTFVASYQKLSLNGSSLEFMTDYGTKLTIANSGAATFLGPTVTIGTAVAATNVKLILNGVVSKAAGIEFHQSGTPQWYIGNGIASEDNNFELYNSNGTMAMKIIKSTNAINFIGNVGLGLASPTGQLSIKNQISNGSTPVASYAATNGVDGQNFLNGYYAVNSDGLGSYPRYFDIVSTGSPDGSNGGSNIRFFTNPIANNSPAVERMRITSGGGVRITSFTTNGLVGTDSSGNLGVVNTNYTEIATGTITYSMNSGAPWGINNSFPATIRDYNDDGMAGSASVAASTNLGRGVTFDLGSAKAVRRIVERGYPTKNLNIIVVQYSTDNSNWTDVHAYYHIYGNTQKDMQFNPTGAISARYWRWFIHDWTEREVQNYYTYEAIIYT
jgi:hypothetical protein